MKATIKAMIPVAYLCAVLAICPFGQSTLAFIPSSPSTVFRLTSVRIQKIHSSAIAAASATYIKIPDDDDTPIPFVDVATNTFIDCYADSIVTLSNGITYTVGEPCDYAVALGYVDERQGGLVPLELDDPMMDDVFPVAELIIEEEFGEELSLQRTPQTLTLVGELEEGEEDDEEDEDDNFGDAYDNDEEDVEDDEEEVEILLSFEHRGKEFHVVRLLDPVLLVGTADSDNEEKRILLTPKEADAVMPALEKIFLQNQQGKS
mmetsp:Transcript_3675/g.8314  ORF Transcript_3675/g.8314 Transcript_3675/m.8314 type:complete len:262 (+) Transcript_3675:67-852(+)